MAINEEFYGAAADWIALSRGTPDLFKTAYPYNNNTSYQGSLKAFQDSTVTNPDNVASPVLDDSIIPWKVNEKSDVFNQKYIYPYCYDFITTQNSVWKYESSDYTQNVNGGFRFFIQDAYFTNGNNGPNGAWVYRYSPLNTKAELDEGQYKYLFPIVGFDYSKCYIQIELLYVAESAFDDTSTAWTATSVNTMRLKDIIDDDTKWQNNYFYGINFELRYKGLSGSHSLGMFAYDKIKASPYSGGYYPYGSDFNHYQTAMTNVHDTGQMGRANIGGVVGGTGNSFTIRWDSTIHTDIVQLFKKNYDETTCLRHMGGLKDGDNIVFHRHSGTNTVRLIPYRTYDSDSKQDFIDYVRQQAAYLGFPFSDYSYNLIDNPDKTYIPEINAIGVTTGNYALANTQPDYINAEWTTDAYDKTPYNPKNDQGDDPNVYDDNTTILNPYGEYIYQEFSTRYIINHVQLARVASQLFSKINTDTDSDWWSSKTLYVNNPLDVITQLTFYPLDLSLYQDDVYRSNILLGSYDTTINSLINRKQNILVDMGSCTYFPIYGVNDFRSYPPYSSAQLVIPYCGSVDIDPNLYLNHTISVKLIVDTQSGACLALIYRDNMVVDTLGGQIGVNVPISGIQSQTLAASERQAQSQLKMTRIQSITQFAKTAATIAGGLAMGGTGGGAAMAALQFTVGSGAQALEANEMAKFNIEHVNVPFKQVGTATAATSWAMERRCRLIIKRPMMVANYDATDYGHNTGFATYDTATLDSYSGFTVCSNADTAGIAATDRERAMIKEYLINGIYL